MVCVNRCYNYMIPKKLNVMALSCHDVMSGSIFLKWLYNNILYWSLRLNLCSLPWPEPRPGLLLFRGLAQAKILAKNTASRGYYVLCCYVCIKHSLHHGRAITLSFFRIIYLRICSIYLYHTLRIIFAPKISFQSL